MTRALTVAALGAVAMTVVLAGVRLGIFGPGPIATADDLVPLLIATGCLCVIGLRCELRTGPSPGSRPSVQRSWSRSISLRMPARSASRSVRTRGAGWGSRSASLPCLQSGRQRHTRQLDPAARALGGGGGHRRGRGCVGGRGLGRHEPDRYDFRRRIGAGQPRDGDAIVHRSSPASSRPSACWATSCRRSIGHAIGSRRPMGGLLPAANAPAHGFEHSWTSCLQAEDELAAPRWPNGRAWPGTSTPMWCRDCARHWPRRNEERHRICWRLRSVTCWPTSRPWELSSTRSSSRSAGSSPPRMARRAGPGPIRCHDHVERGRPFSGSGGGATSRDRGRAFRIAALALDNVVRHAPSSNVVVDVDAASAVIDLSVCDDGAGIGGSGARGGTSEWTTGHRRHGHRGRCVRGRGRIAPGRNGVGTCVRFSWHAVADR